jgi:hypothetical protein
MAIKAIQVGMGGRVNYIAMCWKLIQALPIIQRMQMSMNLMQQVAQRWMNVLLLKDWFIQMTKRICSRLSEMMNFGPLFPRTLYGRILFQVVQQNQM